MIRKILVIDDEPDIGEIIRDFFSDEGFLVYLASDALEGVDVVEKERPDLILLDVKLPRVGGLECLRMIKKVHPEALVVMLSGMQDEETAREAIRSGAYEYITKPINLSDFRTRILRPLFPDDMTS